MFRNLWCNNKIFTIQMSSGPIGEHHVSPNDPLWVWFDF